MTRSQSTTDAARRRNRNEKLYKAGARSSVILAAQNADRWAAVSEIELALLLRVVRCLPSRAGVRGRDDATRAGVVQASREETAACAGVVRAGLSGYGDSMVRSAAGLRNRGARPQREVAWISDVCDASPACWMMQRARNGVVAA